jgi:serine/threonine protein kinase
LENVYLQGTTCTLVNLAHAVRIPTSANGALHMVQHQPPCGDQPKYLAPELLTADNESFDGHAVDLWAAGIMLYIMLLGSDALFVAPVLEDRTFIDICVNGRLQEHVGDKLSAEAIDLLQNMLRLDPSQRLTLEKVQAHVGLMMETVEPNLVRKEPASLALHEDCS